MSTVVKSSIVPMSGESRVEYYENLLKTDPIFPTFVEGVQSNPSSFPYLLKMFRCISEETSKIADGIEASEANFMEFLSRKKIPLTESPKPEQDSTGELKETPKVELNDFNAIDILWGEFDSFENENDLFRIQVPKIPVPELGLNKSLEFLVLDESDFFSDNVEKPMISHPAKKRKRESSEMFDFPIKMTLALNNGEASGVDKVVDEYLAPDIEFNTPKLGSDVVIGADFVKHFFRGALQMHPDVIFTITEMRMNKDHCIIYKGTFDGTFVPSAMPPPEKYNDAASDDDDLLQLVLDGRENDPNFGEMGADERSMLIELTERCRKQKEPLRVKANWVGRISQSKNDGTKLEKIAHLSFDWKLWSIQAFS